MNQLLIQCSEIVKNGVIRISNDEEKEILNHQISNTNFINIDIQLPSGNYHLELSENGDKTKRNFKL